MKTILAVMIFVAATVGLALYGLHHEANAASPEPSAWPMTDMEQRALVGIDVLRDKLVSDAAHVCSISVEHARAVVQAASSIQSSEDAIARDSRTWRKLPEGVALVRSGSTWNEVRLR